MNDPRLVEKLAHAVRKIGLSGVPDLEMAVAEFLYRELHELGLEERLRLMELLAQQFGAPAEPMSINHASEGAVPASSPEVMKLLSLVLGNTIRESDINSKDICEKFLVELNTLFDTLNGIISVINITLLGQSPELETIRKVIGSNIEGDEKASLKEYLDRIQKAFLVAHSSFQSAAETVIAEILAELDPQLLIATKTPGFKFGLIRKAELLEKYEEKYARCHRWFDSGACKERLLREFEKNCLNTFHAPMR